MDIFRYLLWLIFSSRSMYMQRKTGSFEENFCKNTVYRFLNSAKTNWHRFTTLLSSGIINDFMKPLTSEERKDVFIIDDSLFDRSSQSMRLIIDALMDTVMEYFRITESQLEEFIASFILRLPKYMQNALEYGQTIA